MKMQHDRAVRYKKLKSYFFSDTLFVTGKAKSSRGNICAQLFVSDRHLKPMPIWLVRMGLFQRRFSKLSFPERAAWSMPQSS